MFKDTTELAENKLLLLYILSKLKMPISNSNITKIVLENDFINYFSLQQYLSELIDNGFIKDFKEGNTHNLSITPPGESTLEFFINRIPKEKLSTIDEYIEKNVLETLPSLNAFSSKETLENGSINLNLTLKQGNTQIISLNVLTKNEDEADVAINKWNTDFEKIYKNILDNIF